MFRSSASKDGAEVTYTTSTPDICSFKKGEEMLNKELDIVEFARTQRKLKMLTNSLMDESERFLAPYQKLNAICLLSDSDKNENDDPDYAKIPKLLSNKNLKQLHSLTIERFMVNFKRYFNWFT